ncbi:glycerol transporter [Thoreauomyces humboldtii]|nr:glycerol transporter [Thoreauomyces humboldtii]
MSKKQDSVDVPLLPRNSQTSLDASSTSDDITRASSRAPVPASRWKTPEFFVYYLVIAIGFPSMCLCAMGVSKGAVTDTPVLSAIFKEAFQGLDAREESGTDGRTRDNSDPQYASFRNNIPLLLQVAMGYLLLSHAIQRYAPRFRSHFSLLFSVIFLTIIHGTSILKIAAITGVNYIITKTIGHLKVGVAMTWIWSLGILYVNSVYDGYKFGHMHSGLAYLDALKGINMRWWITFNFSTLRMISFSMDYYWACGTPNKARQEVRLTAKPHPLPVYSLLSYACYLTYVPLYLAGPIITFNDFTAQFRHAPREVTVRSTVMYAIRWVSSLLVMEYLLHTVYVVAIKDTRAWEGYSPFQMSMVGYFNLTLIWLKLLIIWRFFRLWALSDRVTACENMTRCMSNNYSAIDFWRAWHRSYNRWLVRYLYVPLGGAKYYALNIWPTFTFVAVWHDISLRLLTWGWMIAAFILPEVLLVKVFGNERWRRKIGYTTHRHLAATAGVANILMMMTANLVGFVVGLDGVKIMLAQTFNRNGLLFMLGNFVCIFSTVQIQFELRNEEARRGWKA